MADLVRSRDRVFGLHGLLPRSFQEMVRPNYSLSVDEVYRDMAIAHINYSKRLELLRQCSTEIPWHWPAPHGFQNYLLS
jgi:hypothetical protein